ncbi:MAG: serine/threonine protein kinase [Polyangiaceae bacterium]|nr:serine/threonine protein kinase [Polyangiaceae bacterium]
MNDWSRRANAPAIAFPAHWTYASGDTIAGRYRLTERVGRGGYGEVWAADDVVLNGRVAIKLCRPLPLSPADDTIERVADRLRGEARVSEQLARKTTGIVRVLDVGSDERGAYMAMELVDGCPLDRMIAKESPLEPKRVSSILTKLADVLAVVHAEGFIHCDVKPANVMVVLDAEGNESIKLADFGLAIATGTLLGPGYPSNTAHGPIWGTPNYLSPEQIEDRCMGTHTDLWALAVMAYEALVGKVPFEGQSALQTMFAIMTRRYVHISRMRRDLPKDLDDWFTQAFAETPNRRFRSPVAMMRAFDECLRNDTTVPPALKIPEEP